MVFVQTWTMLVRRSRMERSQQPKNPSYSKTANGDYSLPSQEHDVSKLHGFNLLSGLSYSAFHTSLIAPLTILSSSLPCTSSLLSHDVQICAGQGFKNRRIERTGHCSVLSPKETGSTNIISNFAINHSMTSMALRKKKQHTACPSWACGLPISFLAHTPKRFTVPT